MHPIAYTPGEPAGVGPDLAVGLAGQSLPRPLVILADRAVLAERAARLGVAFDLPVYRPGTDAPLSLIDCPLTGPVVPGRPDPAHAAGVLASLDRAVTGCMRGEFAALVTGPVHKGVIRAAGYPFTGHTEYLAKRTGAARAVMMLVGGGMRVALATTHLPLRAVADAITPSGLEETLRILYAALRRDFGVYAPRILVAGLNPHAGEGGHLGREEIEVTTPVLERLRGEGMDLTGPLPADTLFQPKYLQGADAVLAMYHDQGLPVLKHASFGAGVNVTLGLPIVRTSVDHGTALDLAASGRAHGSSLMAAIALAAEMAGRRDVAARSG